MVIGMTKDPSIGYVVGLKQTAKVIIQKRVKMCYIAEDADKELTQSIIQLCNENNTPITYISTMEELGEKFNIKVGAAAAAEL